MHLFSLHYIIPPLTPDVFDWSSWEAVFEVVPGSCFRWETAATLRAVLCVSIMKVWRAKQACWCKQESFVWGHISKVLSCRYQEASQTSCTTWRCWSFVPKSSVWCLILWYFWLCFHWLNELLVDIAWSHFVHLILGWLCHDF